MASLNPTIRPILIPQIESFEDVRQVLGQQMQAQQQALVSSLPVTDYGGTRISNIGSPQQTNDAVNLGYLHSVIVPQVLAQVAQSEASTSIPFGSGGGINGIHVMSYVSSHLTPQPKLGYTQQGTLTLATSTLNAPFLGVATGAFRTQIIQDATGGRSLIFSTYYRGLSSFVLDESASTYAVFEWQIDPTGAFAQLMNNPPNGWSLT